MPITPPAGVEQHEGHGTWITFSGDPDIQLFWYEVTPPGLKMAGDMLDMTHLLVEEVTMGLPPVLAEVTDIKGTCGYDEAAYGTVLAQKGVNQSIDIHFLRGDKVTVWGYLSEFQPGGRKKSAKPTAAVTIKVTNRNGAGAETKPVYTAAP